MHWPMESRLKRDAQIADVLARHGFDYLLSAWGLEHLIPHLQGQPEPPVHARPVHLRMAIEELGATYIKLGQLLSTRADLLPPDYLEELAKLQDAVPPVPSEVVMETLVAEFGRPLEAIFASFDPTPLAAASIGQAHTATLLDGSEVVVKVRRPGVVEQAEQDLEILRNLAAAASRYWKAAEQYDVVALAQEFAQALRAEFDYLHEGRNAERFATNFAQDPAVHIPRVYWDATTSRVLTLEHIRGLKLNDPRALERPVVARQALANRGSQVILKMVFDDRFFHADLHPGNFFIEAGDRFGLIDFGTVGVLDERTEQHLAELVLAVTHGDYDRLVDAVLELTPPRAQVDRRRLRQDLEEMIAPSDGQASGAIGMGPLLKQCFEVIRRYRLHLPANVMLLIKTIIMTEGLGEHLDPEFRLTTVIKPYTQRLLLRQYAPSRWLQRLGRASMDMAQLGVDMPQQVHHILSALEQGTFQIAMRPEGVEPVIRRVERLANRLVLGILAAAFIAGTATLLSVYHPPGWERLASWIYAIGFGLATVLGVSIAWRAMRSRDG
jgi:ubiquinone biosynthesis protein